MNNNKTTVSGIHANIYSALFSALVCVATMAVRIPTPGTGGYIHLGDAFVIMAGVMLGAHHGGLSAGLGSALADIFSGYAFYAPATFVIKGLAGAVCGLVYHGAGRLPSGVAAGPRGRSGIPAAVRCVLCGLLSMVIVVLGYLGFELAVYGSGAFASVIPNLIQTGSGIVIASFLRPVLEGIFRHLSWLRR
jgi:uncharacterized membrane protein